LEGFREGKRGARPFTLKEKFYDPEKGGGRKKKKVFGLTSSEVGREEGGGFREEDLTLLAE